MKLLNVLMALMLLAGSASAWGPLTQKHICHEAVKFVWGVEAVGECIPLRDEISLQELCESAYSLMGEDIQEKCLKGLEEGVEFHPSTVSYSIFEDEENHMDYFTCPIKKGSDRDWICGDKNDRPAYETSLKWFREAENAPDRCTRINYFCLAASYYADSENSLRAVKHVGNDCVETIEASIDRSIDNGLSDWSANMLCRFDNEMRGSTHRDYDQRMGESSSTVNRIIANLTIRGLEMKDRAYKPRKGVILLANSIDAANAADFIQYLRENSVNVVESDAEAFQTLRYNENVIVLGGQNAPEGVGEVSGFVLSQDQEESLLQPGASMMFQKSGLWQTQQNVYVLAGHTAEDTRRAWESNKKTILSQVKG
ncbi:MAG: hypothetical protein GF416_00180 [Candidatus Altiarchaeales archaeon]|nr:hypothetical protein [Candidatus Altiarchaeales archaeon]MBD3415538.1 hypothetical protein [Candidatus Altiarchaeales archaeon]